MITQMSKPIKYKYSDRYSSTNILIRANFNTSHAISEIYCSGTPAISALNNFNCLLMSIIINSLAFSCHFKLFAAFTDGNYKLPSKYSNKEGNNF